MVTCTTPLPNRVCVSIKADQEATVTVTNARVGTGTLKICKLGQDGVTGSFAFTVAPGSSEGTTSVNVPVGQCTIVGTFPANTQVEITETPTAGMEVASVDVAPATEQVACSTPQPNRVCVHITGGQVTADRERTFFLRPPLEYERLR
jgi:hypothetical protein